MNHLPDVIKIEQQDKIRLCKWEPNYRYVDGSKLLLIDHQITPDKLPSSLPSDNITYGQTYLKCPFDDQYFLIEEFEDKVMNQKIHHIIEIACLLGATKIEYDTKLKKCEFRKTEVNGLVDFFDTATIKARFFSETNKNIEKKYSRNETLNINKQLVKYEEALEYAERHHLRKNLIVDHLLRTRKGNQLNTFKESANISEELNTTLDIAGKIGATLKEVNINIDSSFKQALQIKRYFDTTFTICFDGTTPE